MNFGLCMKSLPDILTRQGAYSFFLLIFCYWLPLFFIGLNSYQGSTYAYVGFSIAFLVLLISGFYKQTTYAYSFLAALLWLGFWLKVTFHLATGNAYVEPAGRFISSATSWDKVLIISTVSAIGVIISRILFSLLFTGRSTLHGKKKELPKILGRFSNLMWVFFFLVLIAVLVANIFFGIFIIGFKARTTLMYPLNALITLMLVGGGFTIWASCLLWWEVTFRKPIFKYLILLQLSGLLISISMLSRGLVVIFSFPILYSLYKNRACIIYSNFKVILLTFFFITTVVFSFFTVNQLRDKYYFIDSTGLSPVSSPANFHQKAMSFINFSFDRWVGVEGVMAVSSYPDASLTLFKQAVLESKLNDQRSIYQMICPWPSDESRILNSNMHNFFSLPGGVGFLYYSCSVLVLFLLIIAVVTIMQCVELCIFSLTGNPLLCSGLGFLMAITFAHFGGIPRFYIPVIEFIFIAVFLIAAIQSEQLLRIFKIYK